MTRGLDAGNGSLLPLVVVVAQRAAAGDGLAVGRREPLGVAVSEGNVGAAVVNACSGRVCGWWAATDVHAVGECHPERPCTSWEGHRPVAADPSAETVRQHHCFGRCLELGHLHAPADASDQLVVAVVDGRVAVERRVEVDPHLVRVVPLDGA